MIEMMMMVVVVVVMQITAAVEGNSVRMGMMLIRGVWKLMRGKSTPMAMDEFEVVEDIVLRELPDGVVLDPLAADTVDQVEAFLGHQAVFLLARLAIIAKQLTSASLLVE